MTKGGKVKLFPKETDLCAAFISALPKEWVAYPETAGWDILLIRKSDGYQCGIQAKLRFNVEVLSQCLESPWPDREGPDYRAVLVPAGEGCLSTICAYIGVAVLSVRQESHWDYKTREDIKSFRVWPELPGDREGYLPQNHWFDWMPTKRCRVPEYVPDVAAGASAPLQLTQWKIAAIKLAILMERRGFITRADFKHVGIDSRRWLPSAANMVAIDPEQRGRYFKGPCWPNLSAQHPTNYGQIEADYAKWAPPPPPLLAQKPCELFEVAP